MQFYHQSITKALVYFLFTLERAAWLTVHFSDTDVDPMMEVFCETDVEPVPDALWPNENEILCSAVSSCTRYIALGLDDALVTVWDRQSGEQMTLHFSTQHPLQGDVSLEISSGRHEI